MDEKINVQGKRISIISKEKQDYISLTDIAKYRNSENPADIVKNWMRSKSTIEYLGLWEKLYNPVFKLVEFDQFKNESGANYFVLSPQKWIESTNAIGLISRSGRYSGTYAHKDIAFEFASWISAEFKLYLIKEFERLKEEYYKGNRPARPLPQGMLNYGGYFYFNLFASVAAAEWVYRKALIFVSMVEEVHTVMRKISATDARLAGMMGVPAGRAIGMCWETEI